MHYISTELMSVPRISEGINASECVLHQYGIGLRALYQYGQPHPPLQGLETADASLHLHYLSTITGFRNC